MENRWTADEKYIFEKTGTYSVTGGRTYYKKNPGKAIVAVVVGSNYTWPCLISTNPDYIKNYCSYNPSAIGGHNTTVQYLGMTWYFAVGQYGWTQNTSSSGFAPRMSTSEFTTKQTDKIALKVLQKADVKIAYSQRVLDNVKNTIINNELIQKYCTSAMIEEE